MDPLRLVNISAFYGDRDDAIGTALERANCDVMVGDYLAEITMGILAQQKASRPELGFARSLVRQLEGTIGPIVESGIRVVTNAGGVNPEALSEEISRLANSAGVEVRSAFISGDDLLTRLEDGDLGRFRGLHDGALFDGSPEAILAFNAYLGSWGITKALRAGASIVVCPRVTDAAVAIGPAAWRFGWSETDWDQLAGAAVAGHLLECAGQATGGNFAFYQEIPNLVDGAGRPIVEIEPDGSFVVELMTGAGGAVTVETLTAQLLYEVDTSHYLTPDVTVDWDSIRLESVGSNKVRVFGVRGLPPPPTLKAGISHITGYSNQMTLGATAPDAIDKLKLAIEALGRRLPSHPHIEQRVAFLQRVDRHGPLDETEIVEARVTVTSPDAAAVGRAFSNQVVGLSLETYPGFFLLSPPGPAHSLVGFWPTTIDRSEVSEHVILSSGERYDVPFLPSDGPGPLPTPPAAGSSATPREPVALVPLGTIVGARSGDKGGNANLGVWARTDEGWDWLESFLTTDRFRLLVPECADLRVDRYSWPNLRALNFVIHGILGKGAAASVRPDPQAKGLGEFLRSRYVPIPQRLVANEH